MRKNKLYLFLKSIKKELFVNRNIYVLLQHNELDRLKSSTRYQDDKRLIKYGHKVYSQNDEDGIIREIFNRIGVTNKVFIELGIGDGLENNTLALLFDNWKGLWVDSSSESIKRIRKFYATIIKIGQLKVVKEFLTADNINELLLTNTYSRDIDLLSIDIDGNDYHILRAIKSINPRVIVLEYNAKFSPPLIFCMDYQKEHKWLGDDCQGASLKFLEMNLPEYCLVGCNITGSNAFFVKKELVEDKFFSPFTAENHYEPSRYYLTSYSSGHSPSYNTLAKSMNARNGL